MGISEDFRGLGEPAEDTIAVDKISMFHVGSSLDVINALAEALNGTVEYSFDPGNKQSRANILSREGSAMMVSRSLLEKILPGIELAARQVPHGSHYFRQPGDAIDSMSGSTDQVHYAEARGEPTEESLRLVGINTKQSQTPKSPAANL